MSGLPIPSSSVARSIQKYTGPMYRYRLVLAAGLALCGAGGASLANDARDWGDLLKQDQAKVVGARLVWQRTDRCGPAGADQPGAVFFVAWSAEAPVSAESRDAFVTINATASWHYLAEQSSGASGKHGSVAVVCLPAVAKPDTPPRKIHFVHDAQGVQRTVNFGRGRKPERKSISWAQLFGGDEPVAPVVRPDVDAGLDLGVVLLEELAGVVVPLAGDCDAMARATETFADQNKRRLKRAGDAGKRATTEESGRALLRLDARMTRAARRLVEVHRPCGPHEGLARAMRRFE